MQGGVLTRKSWMGKEDILLSLRGEKVRGRENCRGPGWWQRGRESSWNPVGRSGPREWAQYLLCRKSREAWGPLGESFFLYVRHNYPKGAREARNTLTVTWGLFTWIGGHPWSLPLHWGYSSSLSPQGSAGETSSSVMLRCTSRYPCCQHP